MISSNGLVDIKKIDGDTYITITEKGDDVSEKLLRELIAYEEFANINKTDTSPRSCSDIELMHDPTLFLRHIPDYRRRSTEIS